MSTPPDTAASATTTVRSGALRGMARVDTSGSPRIPVLMQLVGALSRSTEPEQVLRAFSRAVADLYGARGYISLSTRGLEPGQYRITRLLPDGDADALAGADTWTQPEAYAVHSGGLLGEIVRTAYPEIIHHLDITDDPVLGDTLAGFGSLMAIPLFDDGEPLNWAITIRRDPEGFSVEELEEWILRSNLVGGAVKSTRMARELEKANARIRREVDQIAKIHESLIPRTLPEIPGVAMAAHYQTFDGAGGDMYDFVPLGSVDGPDRPWAIVIADASGHGPAAATVVAMLSAILYAAPPDLSGPGAMLDFANKHLCARGIAGTFVTAIIAIYDPATRRFTYARAGHNPAVMMRAGDGPIDISRLDQVGGVPLGVVAETEYEEHALDLADGHSIVLYTDGITESTDPDGTMFGVEGIERSLTACTGYPECAIGHITEAVRAHEAGARPGDDQMIVAIRVGGA